MVKSIDVEELSSELEKRTLIDVRTPAEYDRGHIPQALSLPLFSNEERAIVGTLYKQTNPENAFTKGLEFVGPKMVYFVKTAQKLAPKKKVIIHCWRGGKRSGSIGWLLGMAGFDVVILKGGYKAYRNFILKKFFEKKAPFLILGGRTGCGKTKIIKALKQKGEQVIDLEGLAHHKGSAFGALGEIPQPVTEQFENNLYQTLLQIEKPKRIWLENESKGIGQVFIPEGFWLQMKNAPLINIELPFEERVKILVAEYAGYHKTELLAAFQKIKKRLGGQNLQAAEEALKTGDFAIAAAIALRYYDKAYQYLLDNNSSPEIHMLSVPKDAPEKTADQLIQFADQHVSFDGGVNI